MLRFFFVALLLFSACNLPGSLQAQEASPYSRKNSFGVFGEYSNDSSHILLGTAEQRKLLNFGVSYSRSLLANHFVDFQYMLEIRPVILESDPLAHLTTVETINITGMPTITYAPPVQSFAVSPKCEAYSTSSTGTFPIQNGGQETIQVTNTQTCGGRKWTFGEGLSPVGIKLNFRRSHRLQPVFTGLGGYLFTTEPIPVSQAGSYNFSFELGAGVELYRSAIHSNSLFGNRSLRVEYRYHHISNHDTAQDNPGIDNGLFQLTYAFGR